jgi:hypothetical protein
MTASLLNPDLVVDRESFVRFAEALVADREQAEGLERESPEKYRYGGANGWQNGSISAFLDCAVAGAQAQSNWGSSSGPSWQDLAVFLYLGKIYE